MVKAIRSTHYGSCNLRRAVVAKLSAPVPRIAARRAADSRLRKEGVMMKPKMKLTLLACALGAASIATAQTVTDIAPPNDVIRLPGSVTAPIMPVVVSPPSSQAPPVVRSLGAESTMSDEDTLTDGAAPGGADTTKRGATTGQPGIVDSGDKRSNNAATAAADTGVEASTNPSTGDTSNIAGQNDQPGNSTTVPASRPDIPRTNAPADAAGASSGK
jgi:hypothetical protein